MLNKSTFKSLFIKPMLALALFLAIAVFYNCDNSITPIIEGKSIYTIYGVLDLDKQTNFIRINDVKTQPNSEEELELDVRASLTNLNTLSSEVLEDSIIIFDGNLITHNYYTTTPIQFETDYRFSMTDSLGTEVNIITKTPLETSIIAGGEDATCCQNFYFEIEGVNREIGESIEFEVGFEYRDRMIWGRSRDHIEEYNSDTNTLRLIFSPNAIISDVSGPGNGFSCRELSSDTMRLRYTHFSSFEGEEIIDETGNTVPGGKIIIAKYDRQGSIDVNRERLANDTEPCVDNF